MDKPEFRQFEIILKGRVQGVGLRAAARSQARMLRLHGWIENLPDGSVRAVFNGESEKCMQFINWCRQGNGFSWVDHMDINEMEPLPLDPFHINY
jgi:acylphosphatase